MEAAIPRNGSGVYGLPAAYLATTGTTITATQHNVPLTDIEADLNAPRPVGAGGTGASTAAVARDNLGLTIGSDVQAFSTKLTAIAALTPTDGNFIVGSGTTWIVESGATVRASLGLVIGTDVAAASISVSAGTGMSGGGDLTADRTLGVDSTVWRDANPPSAAQIESAFGATIAGVYTGSASSNTDFPIGTVLTMEASSGLVRNTAVVVCLSSTADRYVKSGDIGAGSALSGTWRTRGPVSNNSYLVQRTA